MKNEQVEKSAVGSSSGDLGETFWNEHYKANTTGWDLGQVSPPLKAYIDQLSDKDQHILIPGCGNSYEAEYLLEKGFSNITLIDIAPELVERLKSKFQSNPSIRIVLGDFFSHKGKYSLILEQTFFCALSPALRRSYAETMKNLLTEGGKIAGVLFNKEFEHPGPPFGGSEEEYRRLFENSFEFKIVDSCNNSFSKREGSELFIVLVKK